MSQLDLAGPVPILALWNDPQLLIKFDQPIFDWPLEPGNWDARIGNQRHLATEALVLGDQVICLMYPDESDPGPNVVSYLAFIPDVQSLARVPAARFDEFPIA